MKKIKDYTAGFCLMIMIIVTMVIFSFNKNLDYPFGLNIGFILGFLFMGSLILMCLKGDKD